MGWTGIYSNLNNRAFVNQHLVDSNVIETTIKGNQVYQLSRTGDGKGRYIRVTLLNRKDGEVFYKDMDESCGPCYYDCPEKYLKQSTQTDDRSVAWREACRKNKQSKKEQSVFRDRVKALSTGSRVKLVNGEEWIFQFNHTKVRFAGRLANVAPGKQNSTFAVRYSSVVEIL